jgi:hypothetical protein
MPVPVPMPLTPLVPALEPPAVDPPQLLLPAPELGPALQPVQESFTRVPVRSILVPRRVAGPVPVWTRPSWRVLQIRAASAAGAPEPQRRRPRSSAARSVPPPPPVPGRVVSAAGVAVGSGGSGGSGSGGSGLAALAAYLFLQLPAAVAVRRRRDGETLRGRVDRPPSRPG